MPGTNREDDLCRRVKLFADIELNCSEIYSLLINLCPDKSNFWDYLSKLKQNYASISVLAERYCRLGKLPGIFMHPSVTLDDLEGTLAQTIDLRKKIGDGDISCAEALEKVISLEDTACKVYFRDLFSNNPDPVSDSEIISRLRQLIWDTQSHLQILKDLKKMRRYY